MIQKTTGFMKIENADGLEKSIDSREAYKLHSTLFLRAVDRNQLALVGGKPTPSFEVYVYMQFLAV